MSRSNSRVIVSIGNVCALTPNLVGPRHTRICGEDGEDSCGSTKDELKVDLSGRILASSTDLPLKWSGDSGQQLYAISERGGLQRNDMAVTTCRLLYRPWDIRQTKVTTSYYCSLTTSVDP